MEIISWKNTYTQRKKVKETLLNGGVIVYPTETSYGLGADPRNKKAVNAIYRIKHRPQEKALPLIASSYAQVARIASIIKDEGDYVKARWPGPYTVVFRRKRKADGLFLAGDTYAIRVSSHPLARSIARMIGHPLVSTSANLSGKESCYSVDCVIRQFDDQRYKPDLVIDVGRLPKRKASQIIEFIDGKIHIIR